MKPDKLINSMGQLDDELIKEYSSYKRAKIAPWVKYMSVAACLVLVVGISILIWQTGKDDARIMAVNPETVISNEDTVAMAEGEGFSIISISAKKTQGSFVSADTSFLVYTEKGSVDNIRKHLYISDAPEYTVSEVEPEVYEVCFAEPLKDNTVVKLSYIDNGLPEYSWAFQTEGKLSVNHTYPADGEETVSVNTVIEIEFSYADTVGVEEAVTFDPPVNGSWSHNGKTWRFNPDGTLQMNKNYTVSIADTVTAEGEVLEGGYSFSFATYENNEYFSINPGVITVDGINSYLPDEDIIIIYYYNGSRQGNVGRVELTKFDSYNDMIAFAEGKAVYNCLESVNVDFDAKDEGNRELITLNNPGNGYYFASVYTEHGRRLLNWIIQINPISAYLSVTERDLLVWVARNGELASGIPVRYGAFEAMTDADGYILLDEANMGSESIEYVMIGEGDEPLIIGTRSFSHSYYPDAYIYTDKPKYKNTDTIKVWGVIPTSLFYDEIEDEFDVRLGTESDSMVKVTIDELGTFSCEIPLLAHTDDYSAVTLFYKGEEIAKRYIEISNYSLKNYSYEAVLNSDFVYNGVDIEFDVKMNHVSGAVVSGRELTCEFGGLVYHERTDDSGIAHFTIPADDYSGILYSSEYNFLMNTIFSKSVKVYDSNYSSGYLEPLTFTYYVLTKDYIVETDYSWTDNAVTFIAYYIDTEGRNFLNNAESFYGYDEHLTFIGEPCSFEVDFTRTVVEISREVIGEKYNDDLKIMVPVYSDENRYSLVSEDEKHLSSLNGTITFDLDAYSIPEASDTSKYEEHIGIHAEFPNGEYFYDSFNARINYYETGVYTTYFDNAYLGIIYDEDYIWRYPYDYHLYGYVFDLNNIDNVFVPGEKYNAVLEDYHGNVVNAKFLYTIAAKGFLETDIVDSSNFNFTFDDSFIPKVKLAGVVFKDGRFHRIAPYVLMDDESLRVQNIDITTDKREYSPGETVTVDINVTSIHGAAADTALNISVVNEAVFVIEEDHSGMFPNVYIPSYYAATTRDFSLNHNADGLGAGGPSGSEFGDTVYFGTAYTDSDGNCRISFDLPADRVTTYRITVHSADEECRRGVNTSLVSIRSDFFIQPCETMPVKSTDDMTLAAVLISDPVCNNVSMTFCINELGLEQTVASRTGETTYANFGKLDIGTYTVTVTASYAGKSHEITYPVEVVGSTLKVTREEQYDDLSSASLTPSTTPVSLVFYSKETGRYLNYIDKIESGYSKRFDKILAYLSANKLRARINGMSVLSGYDIYDYKDTSTGLLSIYPDGEGDALVTAAYLLLGGEFSEYDVVNVRVENERDAVEVLLLKAVRGESVLADLRYAQAHVSDDSYSRSLIALGLAICGDYDGALEALPESSAEIDGIRAMVLSFCDRETAAAELDRLFAEADDTSYLNLAAAIYMKQGENMTLGSGSVTVVCGEREILVEFDPLEATTVTLTTLNGESITFKDATDDIMMIANYESEFIPTSETNLDVAVEYNGFAQTSFIIVSGVKSGVMRIALPNCFRYDSMYELQNDVWAIPSSNTVTVYMGEYASSTVRIPVMAAYPGEYILEPVVQMSDSVIYCSEPETISID